MSWTYVDDLGTLIANLESLAEFCENNFENPGQPEHFDSNINAFEIIKDKLEDITILEQSLNSINELLGNEIELTNKRIDNLLFPPLGETDSLAGRRLYPTDFNEMLSVDDVDGLSQKFSFFTNALGEKISDITANPDTGIAFNKTNPANPVITENKPLWDEIRNKPTSFPTTSHNHSLSDIIGLIDGGGKITSSLLPSYVDDVLEFSTLGSFPSPGETGKIYIALDTNLSYRWSGSIYIQIVSSPGSTDSLAEGSINKYFTEDRTRSSLLTGLTEISGNILFSDSILSAFGKIKNFISNFITNVLNVTLTGLSTSTGGNITASDTILGALGKLQNQISSFVASFDGWEVGDIKYTMRNQTSGRWLYVRGGTIGNDSSNATELASNQALNLFIYLWDNFPSLTVRNSSGTIVSRGANASADWSANRTIQLWDRRGRSPRIWGLSGNGSKANGTPYNGGSIGDYGDDKMQKFRFGKSSSIPIRSTNINAGSGTVIEVITADGNLTNDIFQIPDGNGSPRLGDETTIATYTENCWIRY